MEAADETLTDAARVAYDKINRGGPLPGLPGGSKLR
jgi:hypothetical protein